MKFQIFCINKGFAFLRATVCGNIRAHINFDLEDFIATGKVQIAPEGIFFYRKLYLRSHHDGLQGTSWEAHNRPRNLLKVRCTISLTHTSSIRR